MCVASHTSPRVQALTSLRTTTFTAKFLSLRLFDFDNISATPVEFARVFPRDVHSVIEGENSTAIDNIIQKHGEVVVCCFERGQWSQESEPRKFNYNYEEVANENIDLHGILACESCPLHFKHIPLTYRQLDCGPIRELQNASSLTRRELCSNKVGSLAIDEKFSHMRKVCSLKNI